MNLLSFPAAHHEDPLIESDAQARREAVDTERSFLVQAPAGSGKTELLTKRLLALLCKVEEPEQVLAITFTKAATAEMRTRVLDALRHAESLLEARERPEEHQPAIAALEHSRRLGWHLLEQPRRLNIQTIDSLCLRIAYEAPLLSRLGGRLQPTEDVEPLYALAARRTIEQLGSANTELSTALEHLLRLRGVSLAECEKLIAKMLGDREQWLEEFSAANSLSESQWADLRLALEEPFAREHEHRCGELRRFVSASPALFQRMLTLAAYACGNEPTEAIHALKDLTTVDQLSELVHFTCVRNFLLIKAGTWRKGAKKNLGFPAGANGEAIKQKQAFEALITDLGEIPGLREALCKLSDLPALRFTDDEWQTIRSVFTVLRHAAGELRVVFAERSVIDFVEAGITAEHALRNDETRLRWSAKIHHLLVDEFQDTSRRQYTLLKEIVRDWDMNENRTCFLVGDPMQSIYLFRNAELALFDGVKEHGFGTDGLVFHHLTLSRNFRSTSGIVEPINAMFRTPKQLGAAGAERFSEAVADPRFSSEQALHLSAQFAFNKNEERDARQAEVKAAIEIIRRHLPALEQARANKDAFRIGVLVRSRKHLSLLAAALRDAGILYRAVEIETLGERQEIRDLLALMSALTHPMDRIAWLSVLRAPWCGLSLEDLHTLSGSDDKSLQGKPMRALLSARMHLLSDDGRLRANCLQSTLKTALTSRFTGPFSASPQGFAVWIEETWTALGGPHCLDAGQSENVRTFFQLLAKLKPGGLEASASPFKKQLEKLYAQPDPRAPERCSVQLMTIHKAKGLGFHIVLVPGLHRKTGMQDSPLLRWMVRTKKGSDQRELLIAPIGSKGKSSSPTYEWLGKLKKRDERAEMYRLLYVACTRARSDLHLFATLNLKYSNGEIELSKPSEATLLHCGWDYLGPRVVEQMYGYLATQTNASPLPLTNENIFDIAASANPHTQLLRRLPSSWYTAGNELESSRNGNSMPAAGEEPQPRIRIGSLASRARGTVVHALFEATSSLAEDDPHRSVLQSLAHWRAVATAMLQQAGLHHRELDAELKAVLTLLQAALQDPHAQWILGKRSYARSETSWTVQQENEFKVLRCDRVFLAGAEALSDGKSHLWIVDYKTAEGDDAFLLDERRRYEPQLQSYAQALRDATQIDLPLRLGLYYPARPHLLWWEA